MTSEGQKKKFDECYKSGHLNRYTCEFDVLPNILPELYAKGVIDNYEMTHPSEWRNILKEKGIKSDFGIDEITVEEEVKDGETRFIYTFPEPLVVPNCYFSILVFDKNKEWRYFTLEKDTKIFPCPDVLTDNLALVLALSTLPAPSALGNPVTPVTTTVGLQVLFKIASL